MTSDRTAELESVPSPHLAAIERARGIVERATQQLAESEPDELLAELRVGKLLGLVPQQPKLHVITPVWRLGMLLLDPTGALYRVGDIIVTEPERQQGYVSELGRARAELKAAARRGKIPPGRVVNLGARRIRLDGTELEPPLRWLDGDVWLEWATHSWMPLASYITDRLALR